MLRSSWLAICVLIQLSLEPPKQLSVGGDNFVRRYDERRKVHLRHAIHPSLKGLDKLQPEQFQLLIHLG